MHERSIRIVSGDNESKKIKRKPFTKETCKS